MLESQCHAYSSFQTFTYADPPSTGLAKEHISETFHRLRSLARYRGKTVRFYAVGEYGDITGRPHYHAAVYGLAPEDQPLVEHAWSSTPGAGHVDIPSQLEPQSAAYIVGYITGKHAHEHFVHGGLTPPFSVMSRNPGIGKAWLQVLVEALETPDGVRYMVDHQDVPASFRIGSRLLPLGSYLRSQLRFYFYGDTTKPREAANLSGLKEHIEILHQLPPLSITSTAAEQLEAWLKAQSTHKERKLLRNQQRALQIKKRKAIFDQLKTL